MREPGQRFASALPGLSPQSYRGWADNFAATVKRPAGARPIPGSTLLFVRYRWGIGESTKVLGRVSMELSPWRIGDFSTGQETVGWKRNEKDWGLAWRKAKRLAAAFV